jgi:hypothetical protein
MRTPRFTQHLRKKQFGKLLNGDIVSAKLPPVSVSTHGLYKWAWAVAPNRQVSSPDFRPRQ